MIGSVSEVIHPVILCIYCSDYLDERSNSVIAYFLFSLVWSVGATLDGPSRIKFDEFFRNLCEMESAQASHPR